MKVNNLICKRCDYLNNNIPLNKKTPKCNSEKQLNCEIYLLTEKLKNRIEFLKGERSVIFMCSKEEGLHIEDYNF